MKKSVGSLAITLLVFCGASSLAAVSSPSQSPAAGKSSPPKAVQSVTQGSVTVEGHTIGYVATAGTIILENDRGKPTGSMFYVAYVKSGVKDEGRRPVTFFYNGGPGSSSVWLHMGAFGPWRVVTSDHTHTPAAPYKTVNNEYSLLDVTDEVFIDAIGTGYSRIIGKDQGGAGEAKDFYGIDVDVASFAQFIHRYLGENDRWNSPKYIYGESYGTLRSAALVDYMAQRDDTDINGVILQSTVLTHLTNRFWPNNDVPYEVFLPSYAATAWYHHRLPNQPAALQPFLQQVEQFALNDYANALNAGNALGTDQFNAVAQKLHDYTGLSTAFIEKANLRVTDQEFFHQLLADQDETVGRLDSRFSGPSMDPLSQDALYDPQSAAISSAYAAAFNSYARDTLKFGRDRIYLLEARVYPWNLVHVDPLARRPQDGFASVAVDLAQAMKRNPDLQILAQNGYYDLATPYFGTVYIMNHLDIPPALRSHIHMEFYESGHMIYAHAPALKKLHDTTAAFITATDNGG
ncbi:MAG: peptidase S10 [Gammaproteobacteria bacterium]|nr:peptidase S10 [Gammaproteobacteria bacterium]